MTLKKTTNRILQTSKEVETETLIAASANIYPGMPVVINADDDHCDVAGNKPTNAIGIAGVLDARGQQVGVAIASGEPVLVHKGNFPFLGTVGTSQTIVKDDPLVWNGSAWIKASSIAIPAGGTAVTSSGAQPALTGTVPPDGVPTCFADESVTTTGATAQITMRWTK